MKHLQISLLGLVLSVLPLYSQQTAPDNLPTPNATDLGKYGNFPVSYYTGRANISIPIYTMSVAGCEFPVALQYDTSGFPINSLPGWTGHNWTLQAGGAIVRTRNGAYDESNYPWRKGHFQNFFSGPSQLLKDIDNDYSLQANITHNTCYYQPDIFSFNFLGKTGRFFYGYDGQWKVFSDDNLDIIFNVADANNYINPFITQYPFRSTARQVSKSIKGFTIRDDKGFIYEFGGTTDAIDYTVPFYRQTNEEQEECFFLFLLVSDICKRQIWK